jgi:hypothetical protein
VRSEGASGAPGTWPPSCGPPTLTSPGLRTPSPSLSLSPASCPGREASRPNTGACSGRAPLCTGCRTMPSARPVQCSAVFQPALLRRYYGQVEEATLRQLPARYQVTTHQTLDT